MSNAQEATAKHFPEHGPIDPKTGKEVLVSLKNVDITFGKGDKALKAVSNATFDIYKGETFSLIGESGSGKTTLAAPSSGSIPAPPVRFFTRAFGFPVRFPIVLTAR